MKALLVIISAGAMACKAPMPVEPSVVRMDVCKLSSSSDVIVKATPARTEEKVVVVNPDGETSTRLTPVYLNVQSVLRGTASSPYRVLAYDYDSFAGVRISSTAPPIGYWFIGKYHEQNIVLGGGAYFALCSDGLYRAYTRDPGLTQDALEAAISHPENCVSDNYAATVPVVDGGS